MKRQSQNAVSRKRKQAPNKFKRASLAFLPAGAIEWSIEGITHAGGLSDWLESASGYEWYVTDLGNHAAALDSFLSAKSGAILRHFEAGNVVIAINAYLGIDSVPEGKTMASFRIINASYLLTGKTMNQWAEITGANEATITANLLHIIHSLDSTMLDNFGCGLQMTIPSTALEAWKRHIPKGEKYSRQHKDVESLSRAAFFGGWNYIRNTEIHKDGVYFDANSLYAFVMRKYGVPQGRAIATSDYQAGDIGVYNVKVTGLSVGMINPVSVRVGWEVFHPFCDEEQPVITTQMTSVDIELCRSYGITVDVVDGYSWDSMTFPFREFVDKCEILRNSAARGTPLNAMARVLQASLFGKFGASSDNKEIFITSHDLSSQGFERVSSLITYGEQDSGLELARWSRDSSSEAGTIQPAWAAFITAHARAYLLGALKVAGVESLLYAATDSLILTQDGASRLLSSDYCRDLAEYGQFKVVHNFLEFRALAHNRYAGSAVTADGEYYIFGASSGVPLMPDTDYNALYSEWLNPAVRTDEQALEVASRLFRVPRAVAKREMDALLFRKKQLEKRATQTRTEMFGYRDGKKIRRE